MNNKFRLTRSISKDGKGSVDNSDKESIKVQNTSKRISPLSAY